MGLYVENGQFLMPANTAARIPIIIDNEQRTAKRFWVQISAHKKLSEAAITVVEEARDLLDKLGRRSV